MTDYIADTTFWGLVKGALRLENFQLKVHMTILNVVKYTEKGKDLHPNASVANCFSFWRMIGHIWHV